MKHDWYVHDGVFWDKAVCVNCGRTIRDMVIIKRRLPDGICGGRNGASK